MVEHDPDDVAALNKAKTLTCPDLLSSKKGISTSAKRKVNTEKILFEHDPEDKS